MTDSTELANPLVVLGGSFDPPHIGHLLLASLAGHAIGVPEVLLMPANRSPGKSPPLASAADRLSMLEAACGDLEGGHFADSTAEVSLVPSELELTRGGISYTIETVEQLAATGRQVVWVIGSDQAAQIDRWHRWRDLVWLCRFAVAERPGSDQSWFNKFAAVVGNQVAEQAIAARIAMPALDLSSSEIRRRLGAGEPVRWMMPDATLGVIQSRGLYQ